MPILTYPSGKLETNCFIYHNNKDAIIIDPSEDTSMILEKIKELGVQLRALLLTHLHFDHAYGCATMSNATKLPVYAGQEDIDIMHLLFDYALRYKLPAVSPFTPCPIHEGEHFFASIQCNVLHIPGHSPGSLAFYIPEEKAVFTGDILFTGFIGRTDLPGGDYHDLQRSIRKKLFTLPEETRLCCGHGPESSIGDEELYNPYIL